MRHLARMQNMRSVLYVCLPTKLRINTSVKMPLSLRKLPKNVSKRKIKQILFEILPSEHCYIDLPEIIQKLKLNLFSS